MKILFVRYKKSKNIFEGGEQGTEEKFRTIASIVGEDNIDTYYIHDETKKRTVWDMVRGAWYFPQKYFWGLTPKKVNEICALALNYDVVWMDRSVFGLLVKRLKERNYKGKVIGFFHNIEPVYFDAKLSKWNPLRSIVINCVKVNDQFTCDYCDRIVAFHRRDDEELFASYGRHADQLIPLLFRDKYDASTHPTCQTGEPPLCMILAAYFAPNNEGIVWFVKNVMTHVNAKLRIVGKGMARLKEEEPALKDIEVISDAPDLLPYFEEADIMILPVFKGSGMKVKTCESLMYGKNIIAPDEAFMGYELDYSKVGGKCNTAEEFIACIKDFEQNPRPRFNTYSRQMFLEKYSQEAVKELFRKVIEE